jgi:dCTP deaminase
MEHCAHEVRRQAGLGCDVKSRPVPTIHAGFEGTITLEMINLAEYPISLFPKMKICQLIIETVEPPPFTDPSEFHARSTSTGP